MATTETIFDPELIFQGLSVAAMGAFGWAWKLQTRIAILETKVASKEKWVSSLDEKLDRLALEFAEVRGMLSQHLNLSKE